MLVVGLRLPTKTAEIVGNVPPCIPNLDCSSCPHAPRPRVPAVKLNTCSSFIISWLGFLPMQLVRPLTRLLLWGFCWDRLPRAAATHAHAPHVCLLSQLLLSATH